MDSARVIARFEAERQALAQLDHPNIARVLDAGTRENQRPYFVMEYVEGLSITEYCDQNKLTIDARLQLFQQVCQAIQHAHQRGIIHRDIKPSNILVTEQEGHPCPKVIDFGVAKAVAQSLTERTLFTTQGQWFGTPAYMSPEQVDLAHDEVDTRSDVYALGVLLYELLVGALPYDPEALRKGGVKNVCRIIRDIEPQTPSTRLTKLGEDALQIAENRRTELKNLSKRLHRELEWIPLRALRKERDERYQSVAELAKDVEHYLNGEALMAGPPGVGYRLREFARRNSRMVASAAVVLVVLIAGIVASTLFALRAERNLAAAEVTLDFLEKDVLGVSFRSWNSDISDGIDGLISALDSGKFKGHPLREASLRKTFGWLCSRNGMPVEALRQTQKAREIYMAEVGPKDERTIGVCWKMGRIYCDMGDRMKGERLWNEQLDIVGKEHEMAGLLMNDLAASYTKRGKQEEAAAMWAEMLDINEKVRGDRYYGLYPGLNLARKLKNLGQYVEAEELFEEVLPIARDRWGADDGGTLHYSLAFAELYQETERLPEAENLYRDILEKHRARVSKDDSGTAKTMLGLASVRRELGEPNDANELLVEALSIINKRPPPVKQTTHPRVHADLLEGLAKLRRSQNQDEEAKALLLKSLEIRPSERRDRWLRLNTMSDLGRVCRDLGQFAEAERFFTEALKGRAKMNGLDGTNTLLVMRNLEGLYTCVANINKAEPLVVKALKGLRHNLGDEQTNTLRAWDSLIDYYDAAGKPDEVEYWCTQLAQKESTTDE